MNLKRSCFSVNGRKLAGLAATALVVLGSVPALAGDAGPSGGSSGVVQDLALSHALSLHAASAEASNLDTAVQGALDAGVGPDLLAEVLTRSAEEALPDSDLLLIVDHATRLARRDLPPGPVVSRYLQGLSKGVPFPRIQAVTGELDARLVTAARRVDASLPAPTDAALRRARLAAIDNGAYALSVGVPETAFDHSLGLAAGEQRPLEAVQSPLLTLGVLVSSGVAPGKSMEVVDMAWKRGYRGESLERLGKAVGRLSRDEGSSSKVVGRILAMIDDSSQERVFQGLDELIGRTEGGRGNTTIGPGEDPGNRRIPGDRPSDPGPGKREGQQDQPRDANGTN
jgi:hypothetical protein